MSALVRLIRPANVVSFHGGPGAGSGRATGHVQYTPPVNTCDSRYDACTEHHVACDCREAEYAELRQEYRAEREYIERTFASLLAGHVTRTYDGSTPCQCVGCQIARQTGIYWWSS